VGAPSPAARYAGGNRRTCLGGRCPPLVGGQMPFPPEGVRSPQLTSQLLGDFRARTAAAAPCAVHGEVGPDDVAHHRDGRRSPDHFPAVGRRHPQFFHHGQRSAHDWGGGPSLEGHADWYSPCRQYFWYSSHTGTAGCPGRKLPVRENLRHLTRSPATRL